MTDQTGCKPPTVTETRRMNLKEAAKWAIEGQKSLRDAQVRMCIWEAERIVQQARKGPTWDTCFHMCLLEVQEAWDEVNGPAQRTDQP